MSAAAYAARTGSNEIRSFIPVPPFGEGLLDRDHLSPHSASITRHHRACPGDPRSFVDGRIKSGHGEERAGQARAPSRPLRILCVLRVEVLFLG